MVGATSAVPIEHPAEIAKDVSDVANKECPSIVNPRTPRRLRAEAMETRRFGSGWVTKQRTAQVNAETHLPPLHTSADGSLRPVTEMLKEHESNEGK